MLKYKNMLKDDFSSMNRYKLHVRLAVLVQEEAIYSRYGLVNLLLLKV